MWSILFGGSAQSPASVTTTTEKPDVGTIDKTIKALREAQELLEERESRMEKQATKFAISAKRKVQKRDKKGALYDLKRRKMLDKELSVITNKKLTLERQIRVLGTAEMNSSVYESIKEGVEVLRTKNNSEVVNEVHGAMDELSELMDAQDEIDEALGQDLNNDISDDELLKELEELENELENSPEPRVFPEVPTNRLLIQAVKNTPEARLFPEVSNKLVIKANADIGIAPESTGAPSAGVRFQNLNERKGPLLDQPSYKKSKAKGNNIDIRPISKKRKIRELDLKVTEQKLCPAAKKKRIGFSFSKGRHFPRVARLERTNVNRAQGDIDKVDAINHQKPQSSALKPGVVIMESTTSDAIDKEDAANLAILETLYD